MKRIFQVLILLIVIALPASAHATFKFGWVDVYSILNKTEEGKKLRKQLEDEFSSKRRTIEDKKKEFDKLEEEVLRQKLVLSKEALAGKTAELEQRRAELGRLILQSQGEMQKKDKELSDQMLKKITAVVTKIAVEKKYDMVLEKNGTILFAKDGTEVTGDVISMYNKTHPSKKGK